MSMLITLAPSYPREAEIALRARIERLTMTDPDMNGLYVVTIERGACTAVDCRDEILAAQIMSVVRDCADRAEGE